MSPLIVGSGSSGSEGRSDRFGLPTGTSDPGTAEAGDLYYKTDTNKIRVYDGSAWADLASGGGGGGAAAYTLDNSLRFDSGSSSYLSRTPSTAGNRKTWTLSFWVKLCGGLGHLISAGNDLFQFELRSDNQYLIANSGCFSNTFSGDVFRDYSAWQHFVIEHDATNTYCKIYINGSLQQTITASNADGAFNNNTAHNFSGRSTSLDSYTDFYLTDVYFIDGLALAPTAFGAPDDTTGVWNPVEYTGFGSNPNANITWSNNWTASGNGFGTQPPSNAFDGNFSTYMNNSNGGQIVTWNTSSYNLSGTLRIYAYSSSGLYDVYVNGTKAADTGSSVAWIDCGTHGTINEIQFAGTTYNTSDGLGSAGILLFAVEVGGYLLLDGADDNSFHLDMSTTDVGNDVSGNNNDWTANNFALLTGAFSSALTSGGLKTVTAGFTKPFDVGRSEGTGGLTFTPPTPIPYTTSVEVYDNNNVTRSQVNSGSFVQHAPSAWVTVASGSGTINSMFFQRTDNTAFDAGFYAIRVDGQVLYDSNQSDYFVDSPTNGTASTGGDPGGVVVGNYATWNPLASGSATTLSNGNLALQSTTGARTATSTIAFDIEADNFYFELTMITGGSTLGILRVENAYADLVNFTGGTSGGYAYSTNGQKYNGGTGSVYGASYGDGDVIGVAAGGGSLTFYKNGVSQGVAWSGLTGKFFFSVGAENMNNVANFGQRPFAFQAPAGFVSLNTANIEPPSILNGSEYMDVALYTGNSGTQTISGLGFSPDFVWFKQRAGGSLSGARSHELIDIVRGTEKALASQSSGAEFTSTGSLTAFNSDGFAIGSEDRVNELNAQYVAWAWDAGSSTVSNTDGSIASQVRALPGAGFSIVTYSGVDSPSTNSVGHGLGVAPTLWIIKNRTNTSPNGWVVNFTFLDGSVDYMFLNLTNSKADQGSPWNTLPTSTVFTLGANDGNTCDAGSDYVAYCFAPIEGYSAFGVYSGSGDNNGSFVYTGFAVKYLLVKCTNAAGQEWVILDSSRSPYNVVDDVLYANESLQEGVDSTRDVDLLSNGFKFRNGSSGATDFTGRDYLYAAFAENPFSIARAR